jgi:hypothetical protein
MSEDIKLGIPFHGTICPYLSYTPCSQRTSTGPWIIQYTDCFLFITQIVIEVSVFSFQFCDVAEVAIIQKLV